MPVKFNFIAKTGPGLLIGGGILFLLIGYLGINEDATTAGWLLIILGVMLSLVWAGKFKKF